MLGALQPDHSHRLALEITDGTDAVGPEQLEAADVDPGQDDDRIAGVHAEDARADEVHANVGLAHRQRLRARAPARLPHVLHVGEAFPPQEILGDVLGRPADARDADEADAHCLRWRLGSALLGSQSEQTRRPCQSQPTKEFPPAPVFCAGRTHGNLLSRADAKSESTWVRV